MRNLMLCLALAACARSEPTDPTPPEPQVLGAFDQAQERFLALSDNGWAVSRDCAAVAPPVTYSACAPAHVGDALTNTGQALAVLDCERGALPEQALLAMLTSTGGKFYRHPSLPDQVSMDGALLTYRGVASRIKRCAGAKALWAGMVAANPGFTQGPLNDVANVSMPREFTYVRDLLVARLDDGKDVPSSTRRLALEVQVAAWAAGVNATHAACFRIRLGLEALEAVEDLGAPISDAGRAAFCAATRGTDIPDVEFWCGRGTSLKDFADNYQPNAWEYRFQRCGGWESPDGHALETPGLDYLKAAGKVYGLTP